MRRGRPEPQNRSGKPLGTPGVSGELRGSEEGECCGEMMALERGKAERTEREPRPEGRRPGFRFGLGRGLAGRPEASCLAQFSPPGSENVSVWNPPPSLLPPPTSPLPPPQPWLAGCLLGWRSLWRYAQGSWRSLSTPCPPNWPVVLATTSSWDGVACHGALLTLPGLWLGLHDTSLCGSCEGTGIGPMTSLMKGSENCHT